MSLRDQLIGQTEEHLTLDIRSHKLVHLQMLPALEKMRKAAALDGHSIDIVSSFRGFSAQLSIWNAKVRGERIILDSHGIPLDPKSLTETELVHAILRWSALPGASRHHWGSDFDVYDQKAISADYKVQLIPEETEGTGVFASLHQWLDDNLEKFDFYRPYSNDKGGIAPERWHLSYRPVAEQFESLLSYELIAETITNADIELKEIIIKELPEIYQRYIIV